MSVSSHTKNTPYIIRAASVVKPESHLLSITAYVCCCHICLPVNYNPCYFFCPFCAALHCSHLSFVSHLSCQFRFLHPLPVFCYIVNICHINSVCSFHCCSFCLQIFICLCQILSSIYSSTVYMLVCFCLNSLLIDIQFSYLIVILLQQFIYHLSVLIHLYTLFLILNLSGICVI